MLVKIHDIEITLPGHVAEITLRTRIGYDVQYGNEIDEAIKDILNDKDMPKEDAELALSEIYIARAQQTLAYFGNLELAIVEAIPIGDVLKLYETHLKALIELPNETTGTNSFLINEKLYWLPDPVLLPSSTFTFNEFITAKEITRNMSGACSEKLTAIAYLGVIFLRPMDDKFTESDLDEAETKLDTIMDLALPEAMQIAIFYDAWSSYIGKSFSVFEKSKAKGIDMSTHFEKWGWISFLNFVAKNGLIFYKANNKSNLENIKDANLYEVLVWASCEKDQEDIIGKYYESMEKKNKKS